MEPQIHQSSAQCSSSTITLLFYVLICRGSGSTVQDRNQLKKLVRRASSVLNCPMETLEDVGESPAKTHHQPTLSPSVQHCGSAEQLSQQQAPAATVLSNQTSDCLTQRNHGVKAVNNYSYKSSFSMYYYYFTTYYVSTLRLQQQNFPGVWSIRSYLIVMQVLMNRCQQHQLGIYK